MTAIPRRELLSIVCILAIFAASVIGFMLFSADKPDGLEQTMAEAGFEEQEPLYTAPLDYGNDYTEYVAMGILGFFVVLFVSLGITKLMMRKNET